MTSDDVIAAELARLILGGRGPVRHELRMDMVGALARFNIGHRLFSVDLGRALLPAMSRCAESVKRLVAAYGKALA